MAKYFIQDTTLTNIANAIREKTGNTSTLFPENMPSHIRSIQTTESDITGIPDDIVAEAKRVASGMISKMGAHNLTFIAMSDMHEYADEDLSDANVIERGRRANRNAGQAAKLIADKVPLDFFANLGDFATGGSATTIAGGVKCIRRTRDYIADVALAHESFMTPGNHDSLAYSYSTTGECLSYDILTGLIGTYRYVDFDSKKVRVICLNTSDNNGDLTAKERISGNQLQWFCEALDLSAKSDASEWGIVVLSHHPLDWGAIKPAANVLAAYLEGGNYSATHNSVAVSYNFNGKNAAQVIAQFHGHVHGFKVDYINDFRGGTKVATAVQRVAIPNASFYRNNEYGENGKTEYDGIEFGEDTTYNKSDDSTGNNTAFCLVSIDLENKVIYADCFGAGYDRIISYAPEEIITYTITNNLTNVNNSNSATSVVDGSTYSAVLQADSTYEIESVLITMGGADVTASVWNGSVISIGNVTGDIVITASATYVGDGTYTNLVTTSVNPSDGATIYNNPYGYKNGAYVRGSADGTNENMVSTGAILMTDGVESIYIRGATWDETSKYVRFYAGDIGSLNSYDIKADGSGSKQLSEFFTVETLGDNYYKWTLTSKGKNILYGRYYRISLVGTGENLVITHGEPIPEDASGPTETKNYTVTNTLTNVTSSNSVASVTEGATYTATLTAADGYEIDSVTVTMGGTDITSSVVNNYNIAIANVTGNIVITASAVMDENPETGTYTNLVPTSLDPKDSTQIYNGNGYKDGYYSNGERDTAVTGYVSTGGIYMPSGVQAIYVRGCEWDETAYTRYYNSSKETPSKYLSFYIHGDDGGANNLSDLFTFTRLGDKYFKLTPVSAYAASNCLYTRYYRMTLKGSGADLIITHDQPIPQDAIVTYHTVTNNLTNVTSDNTTASVANGSSYSATLTANAGYTLDTVTVTMGGTDITSSAYSGGNISISSVTGNIVITATAKKEEVSVNYTNVVPTSEAADSTSPYNGTGYKNGVYCSSSGGDSSDSTCVSTGYIPYSWTKGNSIYIKGADVTSASHVRIYGYNSKGATPNGSACGSGPNLESVYFDLEVLGDKYYKLTHKNGNRQVQYLRLSLIGTGANLIITLNEPIE